MTRFVESTITFPYKRSLGPVVGAFMTALTEKRILGIRNGDAVLVPPMEWDPATGAELAHDFVEVGPGRHGRVVDVGAGAVRAAPARPRRSPSPSSASTAPPRRCCTRSTPARPTPWPTASGSRRGGRAPGSAASTTSPASCPARSPRSTATTPARPTSRSTRMDYLASITYRNPVPPSADRAVERLTRAPAARPAVPGVRAGLRGRQRLLPDRRARARARARGRPAADGHDHQLRDRHAGAVPGPDRDRAVRAGLRAPRRHRRRSSPTTRSSSCRPTRSASASGSPRCGPRRRRGRRRRAAAWAAPTATSSAGSPTASPTSTTPTS